MNDALFIINRPPSPSGTDCPPCTPHPGLVVIAKPAELPEFSETQANAALIAAAPELLEAAKAMLSRIDNITTDEFQRGGERQERESLRAAIAKAEGRL